MYHDSVCCCALNRDIFFPGPGLIGGAASGTSAAPRPDEDAGNTVGGRVGRLDCDGGNEGESTITGGGNDGESMIALAIGAIGGWGCGLRSSTVSLIGTPAPSRGPSAFFAAAAAARVRGGAVARTSLNFDSFCWYWRAGAGAGVGGDGAP